MADPLYRRIADDLRAQIETGQLEPGAQLPPEEKGGGGWGGGGGGGGEGALGGGEGAAYLNEASERDPRSDIPTVELQTALGEIAYRLGVPEGTPAVSRHERRFIRSKRASQPTALDSDETPWSMQTSFYPRLFALQGAERLLDNEDIEEGTVEYLKGTLGLTQAGYRDWITVRPPKNNEVGFFGLPPDGRVPVFEIFRTAFDQNGKPMRVTVTIFPVDRQQFIIDVGKVPAPQYEHAKRAK